MTHESLCSERTGRRAGKSVYGPDPHFMKLREVCLYWATLIEHTPALWRHIGAYPCGVAISLQRCGQYRPVHLWLDDPGDVHQYFITNHHLCAAICAQQYQTINLHRFGQMPLELLNQLFTPGITLRIVIGEGSFSSQASTTAQLWPALTCPEVVFRNNTRIYPHNSDVLDIGDRFRQMLGSPAIVRLGLDMVPAVPVTSFHNSLVVSVTHMIMPQSAGFMNEQPYVGSTQRRFWHAFNGDHPVIIHACSQYQQELVFSMFPNLETVWLSGELTFGRELTDTFDDLPNIGTLIVSDISTFMAVVRKTPTRIDLKAVLIQAWSMLQIEEVRHLITDRCTSFLLYSGPWRGNLAPNRWSLASSPILRSPLQREAYALERYAADLKRICPMVEIFEEDPYYRLGFSGDSLL